jgi:hypothetical protein
VLIQNEIQAMNKDLSEHTAVLGLEQFAIGMKDRMHVLDLDMLLMYDQDDLHLLIFVARETLVEL